MSERRWNKVGEPMRFWDPSAQNGFGGEVTKPVSDLSMIKSPGQSKFEDVLRALCRVVAELVEVEEARGTQGATHYTIHKHVGAQWPDQEPSDQEVLDNALRTGHSPEFVESCRQRLVKVGSLSQKQRDVLMKKGRLR